MLERPGAEETDLSALKIDRERQTKPVRGKRLLRLILWLGVPALGIVAFWVVLSRLSPAVEVRVATATTVTPAQARSVLSATGYVVAQRKAAVASKATGRLEYLGVEEGDAVTAGQVIARIENDDMKAALEMAKANLEQVRAESIEASLDYSRNRELLASGAITRAEFEISEAKYKSIMARIKAAKAAVKSAEVDLESTYIRAPFDGTVLIKYADVGEIVAPFGASAGSRAAVVVLADMKSLEVEADVSESNIQKVRPGQRCEIILDAYPKTRYYGYVKKIVPTADRAKATVMTKISFAEIDDKVLPEMSARVNFLEDEQINESLAEGAGKPAISGTAVPTSAVVTRNGRTMVFVVRDNLARSVEVETGVVTGSITEIKSGVRAGQKVVLSPPSNLTDGDRVTVVE